MGLEMGILMPIRRSITMIMMITMMSCRTDHSQVTGKIRNPRMLTPNIYNFRGMLTNLAKCWEASNVPNINHSHNKLDLRIPQGKQRQRVPKNSSSLVD